GKMFFSVKKMIGAERFWQKIFHIQIDTRILRISTQKNMKDQLMLFPEDSPVNRSALPGTKKARTMTVTSGKKCLELLERLNQPMLLAKTFLVSSQWHSTRCYLTWKTKVTPQKRL